MAQRWLLKLPTESISMTMMDLEPIYCAEQICVPPELSEVLKAYTKEVIRRQPADLVEFSAYYFANLANIIPETRDVVPPTVPQVSALFRALSSANLVRTCDVDTISNEAIAAGIDRGTLEEVMSVGQLGNTSAVDPVDICLLLITTISSQPSSLLLAVAEVFGEAGSIDVDLCRDVLTLLGKYDQRWEADVVQQLNEQLHGSDKVSYNSLVALPAVRVLQENST